MGGEPFIACMGLQRGRVQPEFSGGKQVLELSKNGVRLHDVDSGVSWRRALRSANTITPAPVWSKALDLNLDLLPNAALAVIDHDHRPVVQVADALPFVLAFAHDLQAQGFRPAGPPV